MNNYNTDNTCEFAGTYLVSYVWPTPELAMVLYVVVLLTPKPICIFWKYLDVDVVPVQDKYIFLLPDSTVMYL
jgi:hypothetical protein